MPHKSRGQLPIRDRESRWNHQNRKETQEKELLLSHTYASEGQQHPGLEASVRPNPESTAQGRNITAAD